MDFRFRVQVCFSVWEVRFKQVVRLGRCLDISLSGLLCVRCNSRLERSQPCCQLRVPLCVMLKCSLIRRSVLLLGEP